MASVNTGFIINPKLKKVVDGGPFNNQPLDINGELCSISGLPQDTKVNPSSSTDYRVSNPGACPIIITPPQQGTVGNDPMEKEFFRQCSNGQQGSSVYFEIAANTYFSTTKEGANTLAYNQLLIDGQGYADTAGFCYDVIDSAEDCGIKYYNSVPLHSWTDPIIGKNFTARKIKSATGIEISWPGQVSTPVRIKVVKLTPLPDGINYDPNIPGTLLVDIGWIGNKSSESVAYLNRGRSLGGLPAVPTSQIINYPFLNPPMFFPFNQAITTSTFVGIEIEFPEIFAHKDDQNYISLNGGVSYSYKC